MLETRDGDPMNVVFQDGSLKVVAAACDQQTQLAAVYLDGIELENVYAEVRSGDVDAMRSNAVDSVKVPSGTKGRNEFLKQWLEAADKADRVKKSGTATMLLRHLGCL